MKYKIKNINFDTIWLWLFYFIIIASLLYYLYALNIYSLVSSLVLGFFIVKNNLYHKNSNIDNQKTKNNKYTNIFLSVSLVLIIINFVILFYFRSDKALISPWEIIPNFYFFSFFLNSLFIILYFLSKKHLKKYDYALLSLFYFLSFSKAVIVYKIGYGFDPFIHQASLNHISEFGYILPKSPYYIGQYSLIIFLEKFFAIPINFSNKLLTPFLAALLIPYFSFKFLKNWINDNKPKILLPIVIILSLIIGFSPFIVSTPQNLAYLFLFASVVYNLNKQVLPFGLLSALATFFIHPIAGIPAIIFSLFFIANKYIKKSVYKKLASYLTYASLLVFPIISLIIATNALFDFNIKININNISWPVSESFSLNFIYFLANNYYLILIVLTLFFIYKYRKDEKLKALHANIKFSLILLLSAFISYFLNHSALIDYEQGDYSKRLITIALIFILPLFLFILYKLSEKINNTEKIIKYPFLVFLSLLITISLYLSYPRFDNYHNSRAYSISTYDLKAVEKVDIIALQDYIVLANQQVSVTALSKKGFHRNYYKSDLGDLYFYSIPTGGPMYQFYLDMVYKEANRETMLKAMKLANVSEAFFIVNDYWWASERIINEALLSSDNHYIIDEGKIYIFHYLK